MFSAASSTSMLATCQCLMFFPYIFPARKVFRRGQQEFLCRGLWFSVAARHAPEHPDHLLTSHASFTCNISRSQLEKEHRILQQSTLLYQGQQVFMVGVTLWFVYSTKINWADDIRLLFQPMCGSQVDAGFSDRSIARSCLGLCGMMFMDYYG